MSGNIGGLTGAGLENTFINIQLSKTGTGVWELRGNNKYSGDTLVREGTLLVNNTTGSGTGTGSVITSGSATLGGSGIITAAAGKAITIASGTTLQIGNTHGLALGLSNANGLTGSASLLTLGSSADVSLTLAGTLAFDLFGGSDGVSLGQSDRLKLATTASTVTLGGSVVVADATGLPDWRSNGGGGWMQGSWQLFDWTGIGAASKSGAFTFNLANSRLAIGYGWDTSTLVTDGILRVAALNSSNLHIWTGGTDS